MAPFPLPIMCDFYSTEANKTGHCKRNGYSLYYELHGQGPIRLCFINGMNSSMGNWFSIIDHFARLKTQYTCLVFDNRGFGLSTAGSFEAYSTHDMANDTKAILEEIGWYDQVNVIGYSMGGMIAQQLSLLFPSTVCSLTLLASCAKHRYPQTTFFEYAQKAIGFVIPARNMQERIHRIVSRVLTHAFLNMPVITIV